MRVDDVVFSKNTGHNKVLCVHDVGCTRRIRQKRSASRRPQVNEYGGYASRAMTNDSIDGELKDVYRHGESNVGYSF